MNIVSPEKEEVLDAGNAFIETVHNGNVKVTAQSFANLNELIKIYVLSIVQEHPVQQGVNLGVIFQLLLQQDTTTEIHLLVRAL